MAQTQRLVHVDPNGKDTAITIVRAELVGVQTWLREIMTDGMAIGSTIWLLTDSQVTLYSIKKAISQPAPTWLNTQIGRAHV